MKVVPALERALLPLHDEQRLAAQDEEALLVVLAGIERTGLARQPHADVETDLGERLPRLEVGIEAARACVVPLDVAGVQDVPAAHSGSNPSGYAEGPSL